MSKVLGIAAEKEVQRLKIQCHNLELKIERIVEELICQIDKKTKCAPKTTDNSIKKEIE